jgi:hypothetical protein
VNSDSRVFVEVRQVAGIVGLASSVFNATHNWTFVLSIGKLHLLERFFLQNLLNRMLAVHSTQLLIVFKNFSSNFVRHAIFS